MNIKKNQLIWGLVYTIIDINDELPRTSLLATSINRATCEGIMMREIDYFIEHGWQVVDEYESNYYVSCVLDSGLSKATLSIIGVQLQQ